MLYTSLFVNKKFKHFKYSVLTTIHFVSELFEQLPQHRCVKHFCQSFPIFSITDRLPIDIIHVASAGVCSP